VPLAKIYLGALEILRFIAEIAANRDQPRPSALLPGAANLRDFTKRSPGWLTHALEC